MDYLPEVIRIAEAAGDILFSHFYSGLKHQVETKSDESPVTQADIAANAFITDALSRLNPKIPILSEENNIPDFSVRQTWTRYWLIDPLDGTRGFIARSAEFCVNIALIENHVPVLGVIYSPIEKQCFYATKDAGAFFLDKKSNVTSPMRVSKNNGAPLHFLTGNTDHYPQFNELLKKHFGDIKITKMNSALKFARIAQGKADIYLRFGSTCEWDTAAGQCIVVEAGGSVVDFTGESLQYNAKSSLINPSFIVMGDLMEKRADVLNVILQNRGIQ